VYLKTGETAKLQRQLLFVNMKVTGMLAQSSCRQWNGDRHWVRLPQSSATEWSATLTVRTNLLRPGNLIPSEAGGISACPLWVMCGRRLGKNFLTLLQHWSGAVMCPACLCGGQAAGPNAMRGSGPNQKHAL